MSATLRARVARATESRPFQRAVIALILLNAVILGLETFPAVMAAAGDALEVANNVIVAIFVAEIALRIYAHGASFFRSGWNVFDFFVVAVALVPAGSEYAVLRILRLLRVLRLLSAVRSMRVVVAAIGAAIPGILSIGGLLVMVVYVFAVSASTLFATDAPAYFGDAFVATASLFRVLVADGWSDIVAPLADTHPWAWLFFALYTIVSAFIVLNLFVAVTVDALQRQGAKEDAQQRADASATSSPSGDALADEVAEISRQLARLEGALRARDAAPGRPARTDRPDRLDQNAP